MLAGWPAAADLRSLRAPMLARAAALAARACRSSASQASSRASGVNVQQSRAMGGAAADAYTAAVQPVVDAPSRPQFAHRRRCKSRRLRDIRGLDNEEGTRVGVCTVKGRRRHHVVSLQHIHQLQLLLVPSAASLPCGVGGLVFPTRFSNFWDTVCAAATTKPIL